MPEKNEVILEGRPLSMFEELVQAKEDFKRAMWEYHPLFILARRILEWLESLQARIKVWNPRHFPNPFYSPSLAVSESLRKAWGQPEFQDILHRMADDIIFRCATQGHMCHEVLGIEGIICVACGKRSREKGCDNDKSESQAASDTG